MDKVAFLIIGAAMAVIVMGLLPQTHTAMPGGMSDAEMTTMMDTMGETHQHPPREVSSGRPVPSVSHLMFPDPMDGFNIQILTRNFAFTPAGINRAPEENEGHAHLYVNGRKTARIYANWYHLPSALLRPGANDIKVSLNANDHSEWTVGGVSVSSVVTVHMPERLE